MRSIKSIFQIAVLLGLISMWGIRGYSDTVFVWSTNGAITKISSNGNISVIGNVSGWNGPVGLTIDIAGNLISGSPSDSSIRRFMPNGDIHTFSAILDSVSALTYDRSAVLYASLPNYQTICRPEYTAGFGYGCCTPGSSNWTSSQISYPTSIAFDTNEVLYVANSIYPIMPNTNAPANSVVRFSKNFEYLGTFASDLNHPWGLAFDNAGNLFISTRGDYKIYKFSSNGNRTTFATVGSGLRDPQGLAFDSAGNLYVANSLSNNILKYSPAGAVSVFASGLGSPCSIAIQPGLRSWNLPPVKLNETKIQTNGAFYFSFTNTPDVRFSVVTSTNVSAPLTNWTAIGTAAEIYSGYYYFNDVQATNIQQRFFRVRWP
jgi:hypothetical protein